MLAASLSGIGSGTDNALKLAAAFDEPLAGLNGRSIKQSFEDIVVRTTQDINVQSGVSDGLRNFYKTLEGQHLSISGVNLDEEAVKMIFYQRAFQASSRINSGLERIARSAGQPVRALDRSRSSLNLWSVRRGGPHLSHIPKSNTPIASSQES